MAEAAYLVPDCNLAELQARIEQLNKRARRLQVPEIRLTHFPDHVRYEVSQPQYPNLEGPEPDKLRWVTEEQFQANQGSILTATKTGRVMQWHKVIVDGQAPILTDWEFIAVLEPMSTDDGQAFNLVQSLPGKECPPQYRDVIGQCDHCQVNRYRKQTFVVQHSSGEFKCVGRQCLKDFLGYHKDPNALAGWAEMIAELGSLCGSSEGEDWLGGRRGESGWDLVCFLSWTASRIRLHGWFSKGKAYELDCPEKATANIVVELLTPPGPYAPSDFRKHWEQMHSQHQPTENDRGLASSAIEWAKDIPSSDVEGSNYLANVNLIARSGLVMRKTTGIAASIIVAYNKAMNRETERKSRPESNWIGEVGKRIKGPIVVKCENVIAHEGFYGTTGIHKLTDEHGNDLVWFASASATWMTSGETYHISATPIEHGEFKGRKQTKVNRVTVWSEQAVEKHKSKQAK